MGRKQSVRSRKRKAEMPILLHGDLKFTIIEARALGDLSKVNSLVGVANLRAIKDWRVTVSVAKITVVRTRSISDPDDPQWNKQFNIPLAHTIVYLEFKIKVDKRTKGKVKIPAERINAGELIREWFPLKDHDGDPNKNPALNIEMKFKPCDRDDFIVKASPAMEILSCRLI